MFYFKFSFRVWVSHPNVEPYGTYFRQNAESCISAL